MSEYILKRVLHIVPTLLIISMMTFVLITLPPGDYLTVLEAELAIEGNPSATHELQVLRERYGLEKPLPVQYWLWVTHVIVGDFGESFEYRQPVIDLIGQRLILTLGISAASLIFTWVVAVPIGVYSATHQYSLGDYFFTFVGLIGLATPNFMLALIFMVISLFVFGQSVSGLFSPAYVQAAWNFDKFVDLLKHAWIPVVIVGTAGTAGLIRITRANMLDVLGQHYIQTAYSKGLHESVVVYKHALRVAVNPLISLMGMQLPKIVSGEVIIAIVLNLPTVGPLLLGSLLAQDMFLAGAIILLLAILLVFGNLLADIALAFIDPRIRYD